MLFYLEKQTIHLSGRTCLHIGETASIEAFIDPKMSSVSTVIWKKKDNEGHFQKISINDEKYIGSTTEFPFPKLFVHLVCEEDKGIYQICVCKYNKVIEELFELKVEQKGKYLFLYFSKV